MSQLNSVADLLQAVMAPAIDVSLYPEMTEEYKEISQTLPIPIPLYGDLTLNEQQIFKSLQSLFSSYFPKFDKLFGLLGIRVETADQLQDLIYQLRTNSVNIVIQDTREVDWDLVGRQEVLKACGDSEPLALTPELIDLITTYINDWIDLGLQANGPLDALQQVYEGGTLETSRIEVKPVDGEALLQACSLDWQQLYNFSFLINPNLVVEILIALRTGNLYNSMLSYLTRSQAEKQIEVVKGELKDLIKAQESEKEPVAINPNVEPEEKAEGKEVAEVEVSESTKDTVATKRSTKSKA